MTRPAYIAKPVGRIENPPGPRGEPTWHSLDVGVFHRLNGEDTQVGRYTRTYPALYDTFCHFRRNGQDFALYSPSYTGTRVLRLPSCVDMGGEDPDADGFCPVEYLVPCADDNAASPEAAAYRDCAFVAGCEWGDDSSWKIQFLDLSRVTSGQIGRDDRFGYVRLPHKLSLADAITVHVYDEADGPTRVISMAIERDFDLKTGRDVTGE